MDIKQLFEDKLNNVKILEEDAVFINTTNQTAILNFLKSLDFDIVAVNHPMVYFTTKGALFVIWYDKTEEDWAVNEISLKPDFAPSFTHKDKQKCMNWVKSR